MKTGYERASGSGLKWITLEDFEGVYLRTRAPAILTVAGSSRPFVYIGDGKMPGSHFNDLASRAAASHTVTTKARTSISALAMMLLVTLVSAPVVYAAEEDAAPAKSAIRADPLSGPESTESLIEDFEQDKSDMLDRNLLEEWGQWKADIKSETGFGFGGDYTAVGFAASSSPGDDTSASGIARFFGSWELLNRGTGNSGSFNFKVEHRHSYTDVAPSDFGFEVGYVGTPEPVFNDQDFRTTEFYWRQNWKQDIPGGRALARVGFVDVKQYFDIYPLATPWSGFHNLVFSTGSASMAVLPDGAFGAMAGGYLTSNFYAVAGIADASADPTDVFEGFDTFFGDFDTFKSIEFGITGGGKNLFLENAHIAFWHLDDSEETGAPGGRGVVLSWTHQIDRKWLPFLRAGWTDEGGSLLEASVSTGFGHMNEPGGNLLGVGLNWGRPNSDTFPVDLDDQWTGEIFYRVQLVENFQITPSVQLLVDPALNPDEDTIALYGLRARAQF